MKRGDIAMVVKPSGCCNSHINLGKLFTIVSKSPFSMSRCELCGHIEDGVQHWLLLNDGTICPPSRLKKIDPPATGDSLPTRADLHVTA
jgi:hypothetical protein